MNTIEPTYRIKAPVTKVWWVLTTAEGGEAWGAGPAQFDATEGGAFSYWNSDIHGINTKVVPEKLLEQDWYGHENPAWKYNALFTFEADGDVTVVQVKYSGDIVDEQRDINDWNEYYFEPIKQLLEK
jgi:uncharacterized protein YndB with AHSA1/START domain